MNVLLAEANVPYDEVVEPDSKACVAQSSAATDRFRHHNGRSALVAGTALPAPKRSFLLAA
jgi:hypothetical protein